MSFLDALLRQSTANALATTGAAVNVSAADPPAAGSVLTAIDATHTEWAPPAASTVGLEFSATVIDADVAIAAGKIYRVDCSDNAIELTLPDTATHNARLGVKLVAGTGAHIATIVMGGINTIEAVVAIGLNDELELDSRFGAYYEFIFDIEANGDDGAWWLLHYIPGKTGG